jgi:uncharacterized protein (TIGR03437 family)
MFRVSIKVLCVFALAHVPVRVEAASDSQYNVVFSLKSSSGHIKAVTVDPAGNIYLTGFTNSDSFPTTPGAAQPKFGGGVCFALGIGPIGSSTFPCPDAFVVKLDPTGKVIYSTYLGGTGYDVGFSIVADAAGNAYVGGTTYTNFSPNTFPTTPGSPAVTNSVDAFVVKLNPQGTALIYSRILPGAGLSGAAIAVDSTGAVYFAGSAHPDRLPFTTTPGAFQEKPPDTIGPKQVVAKLNPAGSALVYATYLTGTRTELDFASGVGDYASGIGIDGAGNAYITGYTVAHDFPVTPGAMQSKLLSQRGNAFITKLNSDGSALAYSTYLGGSATESGSVIRVDSQGNAHVLGQTQSTDFPVTSNALQAQAFQSAWNPDAHGTWFLSTLNGPGSALSYSTFLDGARVMDSDSAGNTYVAGLARQDFPITSGAYQRCLSGSGAGIFVAQFNPAGKLVGGTYAGPATIYSPNAIAAAGNGIVYLAQTNDDSEFVAKLLIDDPRKTPGPCMAQALQNAASFQEGAVAAGEMITILGTGLGPDSGAEAAVNREAPSELAGVRVWFDGYRAPLLYVQARQINAIVPWEIAGQAATQVHVEFGGGSTSTATIPVASSAPAIFHSDFVSTQGAIQNEDGTMNSVANRAARGSVVALWGTGGGPLSPAGVTGALWGLDPLAKLQLPVAAKIGNIDAEVVYAGAAPGLVSGFFQINLRIPLTVPLGSNSVEIRIDGRPPPDTCGCRAMTTMVVK